MDRIFEDEALQQTMDRFTRLVNEERKRSLRYAVGITYSRGLDDAEDAYQEAVLKAWVGFKTYDRKRPFAAWFRVVLHNVIVTKNRLKRNTEITFDPWEMAQEIEDAQVNDYADPLPLSRSDVVQAALKELPEEEKKILVLRYLEEMSIPEIARELALKRDVVAARCKSGMERLRDLLEAELGFRQEWLMAA